MYTSFPMKLVMEVDSVNDLVMINFDTIVAFVTMINGTIRQLYFTNYALCNV